MKIFLFLLAASICPIKAQPAQAGASLNSIGMKFVRIPLGQFEMGQNGPQREYDKNGSWFKTASTRFPGRMSILAARLSPGTGSSIT